MAVPAKELTTWDSCNLAEIMIHQGLLRETARESHSFAVSIIIVVPSDYSTVRVSGNNRGLDALNLKNTAVVHVNTTDFFLPAFELVEIFYFSSSVHSLLQSNPLS